MAESMWGLIRKFGPFAAIAGYLVLYYTTKSAKLRQIIPDLQSITVQKLISKWQNLAVAGVAFVALSFLHKIQMPAAMRAIVQVALYFLIGWEIALAIDPPEFKSGRFVAFVKPMNYNPYAVGQ